jgi:glutamate 5-kinase
VSHAPGSPERPAVTAAARVVVKVGSSSLTTAAGGIDPDRVRALVDSLAEVRARGAEVVLVSSGAIAAGLAPLGLSRRPRDLASQQAAASVGQGLLVHRYTEEFARHGETTGQVLLTVDDVTRRSHYRNAYRTFAKLRELGVVPIVNENDTVATSEIRFGDNDRLAALVAHLVHADLLLLLSDVEGLFDGHPAAEGTSLLPDVVSDADLAGIEIGRVGSAGVGSGGMQTKVEAARIATGAGIPVVLASAAQAAAALAGKPVGTLFHPTGRRRPTRLLWLAHATEPKGRIFLDAGAVHAVTHRRASLLPAGITGASGTFVGGDPVDLVDADGTAVARGLVNYDSDELPDLVGRTTHDLARELGASYEREVVHRDDLVLLHDV